MNSRQTLKHDSTSIALYRSVSPLRLSPLHDIDLPTLQTVRLVATDMDGTLTQAGKFTPLLLRALHELAAAQIPVLIVTGRSAGWVSGLVSYLPVVGAIAENGGVFFTGENAANGTEPEWLVPIGSVAEHRHQLAQMFLSLQAAFPQIEESADNRFRLTDWTFDIGGLTIEQLQSMGDRCQQQGWGFTYSTVQCHIKPLDQDKAPALEAVLQQHFSDLNRQQVITVGDSPNDASLFAPDRFPLSVGVANVRHYADQLAHQPTYITEAAEAAGFWELTERLLTLRSVLHKREE